MESEYETFWNVYEMLEEQGVEMTMGVCTVIRTVVAECTDIAEAFTFRSPDDE
jgi:hypothetical protein